MPRKIMMLEKLDNNIWIFNGPTVQFYGFPFPTRMTVIRLSNQKLWIHSPEKMNPQLKEEVDKLGEVAYLISPNKLHHLFVEEWIAAYPRAKNYAPKDLIKKRNDISFDKELSDQAEDDWKLDINQVRFKGSLVMEEVVFYHKESKTLILTDLIENFKPESLKGFQYRLAKFAGIIAPNGKAPIDFRATFILGKKQAQESLNVMKSWDIENVILSHGECVFGNGKNFLEHSFSWV